MNRRLPWWSIAAVLACFVAGAAGGFALGDRPGRRTLPPPEAPATEVPTAFIAPAAPSPVQVLILLVDSVEAYPSRLEGVWVLTYLPDQPGRFVLGLPPRTLVELPGRSPMRLADAFRFDQDQTAGSYLLVQAIYSIYPGFNPRATVRLSREGVRTLINSRGGLTLGDGPVAADDLLRRLDETAPDPIANLDLQAEAMESLLASFGTIGYETEFLPLLDLLAPHLRADVPTGYLQQLAQASLPSQSADFHVAPIRRDFVLTTLADGSAAVILSGR